MPVVSNVWLSASQTKGLTGIKPATYDLQPTVVNAVKDEQLPPNGGDAFSSIKRELVGKKVDENSNWMTVEEYNPPVPEKVCFKQGFSNWQYNGVGRRRRSTTPRWRSTTVPECNRWRSTTLQYAGGVQPSWRSTTLRWALEMFPTGF